MAPVARSLGDLVYHLRRESGLTQRDVARLCGLNRQRISDIETDRPRGPVPVERLARIFHVPVSTFGDS